MTHRNVSLKLQVFHQLTKKSTGGGNSVEEKILEAFNETYNGGFKSFEEIKKGYDTTEILDTWLEYEGIVGYTRDIIDLLGACDVFIEE
uniref:Uncharacterized protein n=1 Tax=Siphoviridae sp. ctwhn18 TaxID=2825733 RepID=A0A8S5P084_9CAUD|nr:MAG TPA: hypothetical protein [Siphoviridae sp. ctwhn18]